MKRVRRATLIEHDRILLRAIRRWPRVAIFAKSLREQFMMRLRESGIGIKFVQGRRG